MATQDTSKEDEVLATDDGVETSDEEDDTTSTDDTDSDTDTVDTNEDEDSDEDADAETEEEDEVEFTKRFTQFKGDNYEEYVPRLEKAHAEAITEMARLKQADRAKQTELDAIRAAVSKDPDLAEKLGEVSGDENISVDPAILKARQDMEEGMEKDYKDFVEAHPELESDQLLAEELLEQVTELSKLSRKKGKILSMKEALRKAWIISGRDDDSENIAIKAKEVAAKPKTGTTSKKTSKKADFSEDQIKMAKKWGVTPEQLAAAKPS